MTNPQRSEEAQTALLNASNDLLRIANRLHSLAANVFINDTLHGLAVDGYTEDTTQKDALGAMADAYYAAQVAAPAALRAAVAVLRNQGVSWERIGNEFGITRQAAQQRFGA